jgi:hypothetical protein
MFKAFVTALVAATAVADEIEGDFVQYEGKNVMKASSSALYNVSGVGDAQTLALGISLVATMAEGFENDYSNGVPYAWLCMGTKGEEEGDSECFEASWERYEKDDKLNLRCEVTKYRVQSDRVVMKDSTAQKLTSPGDYF